MTPSNTMQLKVIDDDIYYRIIEFKAKNEIIRMNRNYSNVDKRIWTDKYVMSVMLMTKIALDM